MMRARYIPYLLIAPSLGFLTVLFFVPLVQTIALAFQAGGIWSTENFARMAADLNFTDAVVDTFGIVVIVVPLQLLLALAMAMMLQHLRSGRDIVLWIWSIPLGISDLAAGLVWLAILTDKGYLNTVLVKLGVLSGPQSWLTYETPLTLFAAIVVAELWRATAIVLSIGGRNFPVLVSEAFNWQYNQQDYGVAAAYAVIVMGVSLAATLVYLRVLRTPAAQQ